jgi:hypothetical protein
LGDPTPEEIFAGNELVRVFHQELGDFPRQLRSVLQFYLADLRTPEAAERPGLTLTAIEPVSRLVR